jgi:FKBP-type peptidyl-prolyl cis-trans isomerase FkpA
MRPLLLVLCSALLISCSSAPKTTDEKSDMPPPALPNETPGAYLDRLAAIPGALRTPSGLVYREVRPGTGKSPTATDRVSVNYRGALINGKEFDSSYARNEPAQFGVGEVIGCWTEALQKMKVGGKSILGCPSSLAYKEQGVPGTIPPGSVLVFEVELLAIGN